MLKKITLKGEQKKVLFLPPTNPIQIKGVAGSGKTTVALYRAKHLLETQANLFKETRIIIFTYNKTLAAYINAIKPYINGGYQKDTEEIKPRTTDGLNVEIVNFHKWAFRYLNLEYNQTIQTSQIRRFLESFKTEGKEFYSKFIQNSKEYDSNQKKNLVSQIESLFEKSTDFFLDEISWIKGKLITDLKTYHEIERAGRGNAVRISKFQRRIFWKVFESYNRHLQKVGKIDFDDYAVMSYKKLKNQLTNKPNYTHIIVDEAQDLNKAQILTISELVDNETNSLTIIADAAQRIYKSGFTWSEVGIEVRGGRTIAFSKNYRNTIQIAQAAQSLLENESDNEDFTEIEFSFREGPKPRVAYYADFDEELNHFADQLSILENGKNLKSTVVLHRSTKGVRLIKEFLDIKEFSTELVKSNLPINYGSDSIKICTMSSVKGLEFNNVFILDLNDDIIPFPAGFIEADDEFHISTERRLLYTCITRARNQLYLFSSDKDNPSRYLKEINESLLDDISLKNSSKSTYDDELPF